MAKHQHHEEHENHERWLVSYADFMTLLFALFVVLYAMASVDQKKVRQVENAVRFALHLQGDGGGGEMPLFRSAPDFGALRVRALPPEFSVPEAQKANKVIQRMVRRGTSDRILVQLEGRSLTVRLAATDLFLPGGAELLPSAIPVIDGIVTELRTLDKPIRVEGHTDSTRPRTGNNWSLSGERAAAVVRYIESAGLMPHKQLSFAGYADTRPLDASNTDEARDKNRRVDFVVEL
jgi:chemotaxis protein MotB